MRRLLISLLVFYGVGLSGWGLAVAGSNTICPLKGMWKFRIGDQAEWAAEKFNDASWSEVYAPSTWESKGYPGYDGFGWYRKSFSISESFSDHRLVIELGYIDDVDEVFLNGEKIGQTGSFPPDYSTAYNARRRYVLPNNLVHFGRNNVIAVRVYDSQLEGGIVNGELKIESTGITVVPEIDLGGKWQIVQGRSFEQSPPRTIFVPGSWENQGMNDYDGFAVYRRKFIVPEKLRGQIVVLMAGRIDDLDETYINGQKIGATGNFTDLEINDRYSQFRNYVLPAGFLKTGENDIEIRVYDEHGEGGILEGPVGLITQNRFRQYWRKIRAMK